MSRYIDAEKTELEIWDHGVNMSGEYQGVWVRFRDIEEVFKNVPTADVVPVKHGHWIVIENDQNTDDRYKMQCSVCGGTLWSIEPEEWYCCKCGAKMDEVTNNEQIY